MADIKRAQLVAVPPQSTSAKLQHSKEVRKTIRLTVVLPESNEDTCPDFNYKDLIAAAKKSDNSKNSGQAPNCLNGIIDLEDNDDDVKRIAQIMEARYGSGSASNRKRRKGRKDDFADIGMGYDENDSFIDNTDGYDEIIPQNVTTLYGGFYINSGALEFKTDDEASSITSSSSDRDADDNNTDSTLKKKKKKRCIESSDETDRETKTDPLTKPIEIEKKKVPSDGGNGIQPSLKKKLSDPITTTKVHVIKRRRSHETIPNKTVKELLREKREDIDTTPPPKNSPINLVDSDVEETIPSKKPLSNLSIIIESVVNGSSDNRRSSDIDKSGKIEHKTGTKPQEKSSHENVINNSSINNNNNNGNNSNNNKTHTDVCLPENLPKDIVDIIQIFKQIVASGSSTNNAQYSANLDSTILRLERKCKCIGKPSKTKIYGHLASYLRCPQETLIRKAKTLILNDDQTKLKSSLVKLKNEIANCMPSLLESYEKESQRILALRRDGGDEKCCRLPKRRFQWTEITKKLLKDILMMKKRCLLLEGCEKQVIDVKMTEFLKWEVQVLWPDGWMSMNALSKIYTTYLENKKSSAAITTCTTTTTKSSSKPNSISSAVVPSLPNVSISSTNIGIQSKSIATYVPSKNPNFITTTAITTLQTSITPTSTISTSSNYPSSISTAKYQSNSVQITRVPVESITSQTSQMKSTGNSLNLDSKLKSSVSVVTSRPQIPSSKKVDYGHVKYVNSNIGSIDTNFRKDDFSILKTTTTTTTTNALHHDASDTYAQVIDLSDKKSEGIQKTKYNEKPKTIKTLESVHNNYGPKPHLTSSDYAGGTSGSHHHGTVSRNNVIETTSFSNSAKPKLISATEGDDIKKVMEDLKVLQNMSSPKKSVENTNSSKPVVKPAPVSVIAVNKNFTAAPSGGNNGNNMHKQYNNHRTEYQKQREFGGRVGNFQDEFQKQICSSLNQITQNTSKVTYTSHDRYPYISSVNTTATSAHKIYQNSTNHFQNANGHKHNHTSTTPLAGGYSILDDMFANLLTQYGYPKEASTPKSTHHK